jgi:hypothetical protein
MTTKFSSTTAISITPTSDVSSSATFGLAGNLSVETSAEGDEAFFVRTFYPEFVNFDAGYSAADDSFLFGGFPAFEDNGTGGLAEKDWNGQALSMDTLKAIMIEVKPIQAYLGTAATGVLTFSANLDDNDTLTIGSRVYRFKNTPAAINDIKIGTTKAASIVNLNATIDGSGTPGTEYYTGTLPHADVVITGIVADVVSFRAARTGAAGNLVTTTDSSAHLVWGATTLIGGEDVTQPAVDRTLEGSVKITLGSSLLPGSGSSLIYEITTPSLLTFAVPAGWTPNATGSITVTFQTDQPAPLTDKDVNAVVTVALIGSST